ncbi:sodium:solute symporter family protein [Blastopirellula sp. JC732]|uniref:Sodium:solute symporter family protein n=1 Tax=Blastopirellula sediminis TaxID=2894196 RepID=A0A9X1MQ04_9BACT|nr:sodium:solute symporter family protein [Blastopirellula sediminis]MCC9605477.1 sodium:solute symporter family protein [Blastopirellula sediminis]MCC9631223.1 sodium:solute symporter family protein [Blastopirellula sediminis]
MTFEPGVTQLVIICIYLALLLALGLFSNRLFSGSSKDYMLASHSIGPFLLLMSIFGTTMTAFALVGSTGESYVEGVGVYGLLASSSGIVHSLCFFVLGVKLWSFGRKYGYTTQIEFFRDRLESDKLGILLFPILVGLVIPYLLIGVMASGTVIMAVTKGAFPTFFTATGGGIPGWLGSLVVCGVVLIYVFFGGMRGTAWANTFQTIVFMILGVVTFFVIASQIGGAKGIWENLKIASESIPHDKLVRAGNHNMTYLKFATYMFVPLSVGMFPHLFQHWLTAKKASNFKLAVVAHPLFIMIVWAPCVLVGAWAAGNLVTIPPAVHDNPNAILPFLVKKFSNDVLGGFLTAGVLAAIMSSLDSQFLCVGTIFTNDIVVHYGGKGRFSDKQIVVIARVFIILIVAITYALSLLDNPRVFTLGIWCFSGFSALFPLVFACLYWKGLTKAGAYASVLTAIGMWCYYFYQSDFALNPDYSVLGMMPVAPMLLGSTLALIVVSLITPKPSEETLQKFFPAKDS